MTDAALLEIADELYALGLPEFTPARDARAKELKAADATLAARVKGLRKPSLAAWVVNLLVRREVEQVEQLLAVGSALREAQAAMSGDELRALTRQRRQVTAAVTQQARSLATDQGVKVTRAVAEQVEATLTAAMVDASCAKALRSGLLVTSLSSTGVDEVEPSAAVAVPEALGYAARPRAAAPVARPELHVVPDPEADEKALSAAREALAEAEQGLRAARAAYDDAATVVETLEARSMQIQAEIGELKARLAELDSTYEEVDDELGDAEDARDESFRAQSAAIVARDAAAEGLSQLASPG